MTKSHVVALLKVAAGTHLLHSANADPEMLSIKKCLKSNVLIIPSNSQHIESEIKDASFCKTVKRSEPTATYLHSMRCKLENGICQATRTGSDHASRKINPSKKK